MAATTFCSVRPTPVASSAPSSRQLTSSAHLSRPAPLRATQSRRATAAPSSRERAPLSVAAFQLPKTKWWEAKCPPNVVHINSVQQMVDAMAGAGDRLVIVDVFAPWCAACKALYPKICSLIEERPDVLLLAVNFDDNKTLVKALGVKVLPYFLFYRGKAGKLQEFSASLKRIQLLKDAIALHTTDRCYLEGSEEPVLREFPNVLPASRISSSGMGVAPTAAATAAAAAAAADQATPEPQPVA